MEPLDYLEQFLHRVSGACATVDAPRCLRVHSGLSDCDLCVKSCPVESISLAGQVHVLDHCTGCGACLTVCPVSAFDLKGAGTGELLSQASSRLREQAVLFVSCERSPAARSADLVVPCLARVDEALVLGALALGAQTLRLTRGPCRACPYPEAMPRYRRVLDRVRTWGRVLPGISQRLVEVGEEAALEETIEPSHATGPGRRAFFRWVRTEGMHLMASFLDEVSQGLHGRKSGKGAAVPLRHRLLPQFLRRLGVKQGEIPYDPEGPYAELLLDEVKCNACEACILVCPTGAIERREGDEAFCLTLDAGRCVNCGLCLDACLPHALTYRQGISLAKVVGGERQILAEKPYSRCRRCEARFLWSGEEKPRDLCSTCQFLAELEGTPAVPSHGTPPDLRGGGEA